MGESIAESRLKRDVRRLKGDKGGVIPGKLKNPWQGPFKMLRWSGERTCVIDRNGKEEEYNVNRLTKQYEWDAEHPDTSGIMNEQEENKSRVPLAKKRKLLEKPADFRPVSGQMVIFHKETARGHRSPFGIGEILEIRADKTIHYQWYGNYFYNANGTFEAGWYNEREGLGYYGRKASRLDVPWTGEHTEETLTADLIIAIGDDLIGKEKKETRTKTRAQALAKFGFGTRAKIKT